MIHIELDAKNESLSLSNDNKVGFARAHSMNGFELDVKMAQQICLTHKHWQILP